MGLGARNLFSGFWISVVLLFVIVDFHLKCGFRFLQDIIAPFVYRPRDAPCNGPRDIAHRIAFAIVDHARPRKISRASAAPFS